MRTQKLDLIEDFGGIESYRNSSQWKINLGSHMGLSASSIALYQGYLLQGVMTFFSCEVVQGLAVSPRPPCNTRRTANKLINSHNAEADMFHFTCRQGGDLSGEG